MLDDLRYCRNVALVRHDSLSPFLTPVFYPSPLFFLFFSRSFTSIGLFTIIRKSLKDVGRNVLK